MYQFFTIDPSQLCISRSRVVLKSTILKREKKTVPTTGKPIPTSTRECSGSAEEFAPQSFLCRRKKSPIERVDMTYPRWSNGGFVQRFAF